MAKQRTAQAVFPACPPLKSLFCTIATVALMAVCMTAVPTSAPAVETIVRVNSTPSAQAPVYTAKAELNLLRRSTSSTRGSKRRTSSIGHGSYICSPAGFGQRSRCFSN